METQASLNISSYDLFIVFTGTRELHGSINEASWINITDTEVNTI